MTTEVVPKHDLNWTSLFQPSRKPDFSLKPENLGNHERLSELSFEQGLRVVVTSVPNFENQYWQDFRKALANCGAPELHGSIWMTVAEIMRQKLPDIRRLLRYETNHALELLEEMLDKQDTLSQCALIGCLYQCKQENMKAELLLEFLLQRYDHRQRQVQQMLVFYQNLPLRMRQVAMLVSFGCSNREIAEELFISKAAVAEYLTTIFREFSAQMLIVTTDTHGTRYRLIHHLTRLFEEYPALMVQTPRR